MKEFGERKSELVIDGACYYIGEKLKCEGN